MFNKTRIFITLICPQSDYSFECEKLGGCFYKDITGILPMTEGQTISFENFFAPIKGVHWLTQHSAVGIYTELIEIEKEKIDKACAELMNRGFQEISLCSNT